MKMAKPIILLLALAHAQPLCSAVPPKPHAKGIPSTQPDMTGLVAALDKPYEDAYLQRGRKAWVRIFAHARTPEDHPFDLEARDRNMAHLVHWVNARVESTSELRILVVELISQRGANAATYDRASVFWQLRRSRADSSALEKMGLTQIFRSKIEKLVGPLVEAMNAKGSNNGVTSCADAAEGLVITSFDGKVWRSETWYWVGVGAYSAVEKGNAKAGKRRTLPSPMGSLIDIIEVLQPYGSDRKRLGSPIYQDLLEGFPTDAEPGNSPDGSAK